MTIAGVKTGDLVQADVKGDRFYAEVVDRSKRELVTRPISNGRGEVRILTARQIVAHWRRAAGSRA